MQILTATFDFEFDEKHMLDNDFSSLSTKAVNDEVYMKYNRSRNHSFELKPDGDIDEIETDWVELKLKLCPDNLTFIDEVKAMVPRPCQYTLVDDDGEKLATEILD